MKAERLLLIMIVATAILVTPSVLTSPVLAQGTTDTAEGTTDTAEGTTDTAENGNQGTTGGGGAENMYEEFQTCLEDAEGGAAGAEAFATEDEIRTCFIDAGYIQGTDGDNEDENDNDEENEDE
jgi:hypothetical protein